MTTINHRLLPIPFHEPEPGGLADLAVREQGRLQELMETARKDYGPVALRYGNRLSRRWLAKAGNPYLDEIDAVARGIGEPGAHLLNLSYEWTCTSAAAPDPAAETPRLLRTLDWKYDCLGRTVIVIRGHGPAGDYYSATWPGFVGVLTAMAPGRFAVALNQPPMTRRSGLWSLDWLLNRMVWWRSSALPPSHLLRRVCEDCTSFDAALALLRDTPVCLPVFYTLVGAAPGEGAVIERTETRAAVRPYPACIANDYTALDHSGYGRGWDSAGRFAAMQGSMDRVANDFAWVAPPILNDATRISVVANPGAGTLLVQGWEDETPATLPFSL